MIYSVEELKDKIVPVAEKYDLLAVYLFGSYARGEATENSDVDILIDRSGAKMRGIFALCGIHEELIKVVGKTVDLVTVSALDDEEANRRNPVFAERVYKERKMIYERA